MKQKNNDARITLVDENGQEEPYEVLLTFHSDAFDKSYVLLYPAAEAGSDDIAVQAFSYDADANGDVTSSDLHEIVSDEEWQMVEGVLNTFMSDDRLSGK